MTWPPRGHPSLVGGRDDATTDECASATECSRKPSATSLAAHRRLAAALGPHRHRRG
jgi:hypothetical protein